MMGSRRPAPAADREGAEDGSVEKTFGEKWAKRGRLTDRSPCPHYDGFPAVLVKLDAVKVAELRELLEGGWACFEQKRPKVEARRGRRA